MRNIPIPVDTSKLTFVCVAVPRPRLVDKETGEVKIGRDGRSIYQVGLSASDDSGRVDLLNVNVPGKQTVTIGQLVKPIGLVAMVWEQTRDGVARWGVAYRAETVEALTGGAVPTTTQAAKAA